MSSVEFHSSCALLVFGNRLVHFTCTSIVQNYILIHVCVFFGLLLSGLSLLRFFKSLRRPASHLWIGMDTSDIIRDNNLPFFSRKKLK